MKVKKRILVNGGIHKVLLRAAQGETRHTYLDTSSHDSRGLQKCLEYGLVSSYKFGKKGKKNKYKITDQGIRVLEELEWKRGSTMPFGERRMIYNGILYYRNTKIPAGGRPKTFRVFMSFLIKWERARYLTTEIELNGYWNKYFSQTRW